jgi:predicted RNA-binding protein YlxR (DUF448 family)
MSLRDATIDRERRDLVSHQVMDESRLIRFVAGPEGQVVPDLGRKLPGRGLWVEASRASVEAAVKKNGFTRAAKTKLTAPADLADLVERLLVASSMSVYGEGLYCGRGPKCGLTSGVSAFSDSRLADWLQDKPLPALPWPVRAQFPKPERMKS